MYFILVKTYNLGFDHLYTYGICDPEEIIDVVMKQIVDIV